MKLSLLPSLLLTGLGTLVFLVMQVVGMSGFFLGARVLLAVLAARPPATKLFSVSKKAELLGRIGTPGRFLMQAGTPVSCDRTAAD